MWNLEILFFIGNKSFVIKDEVKYNSYVIVLEILIMFIWWVFGYFGEISG